MSADSNNSGERERLYTVRRAVALLPISESTLRRMIQEGKVTIRRIGSGRGMIYISRSELERVIKPDES